MKKMIHLELTPNTVTSSWRNGWINDWEKSFCFTVLARAVLTPAQKEKKREIVAKINLYTSAEKPQNQPQNNKPKQFELFVK